MEREALRHLIREKLADGRLPHDSIPPAWGSVGNNETCVACGSLITKNQFAMERIGATPKGIQFHFSRDPPGGAVQVDAFTPAGPIQYSSFFARSMRPSSAGDGSSSRIATSSSAGGIHVLLPRVNWAVKSKFLIDTIVT
jgi:hypothetical protein